MHDEATTPEQKHNGQQTQGNNFIAKKAYSSAIESDTEVAAGAGGRCGCNLTISCQRRDLRKWASSGCFSQSELMRKPASGCQDHELEIFLNRVPTSSFGSCNLASHGCRSASSTVMRFCGENATIRSRRSMASGEALGSSDANVTVDRCGRERMYASAFSEEMNWRSSSDGVPRTSMITVSWCR